MKKYYIIILCIIILILNIIILDVIEVRMCKALSIYRIFTMNSTICSNITYSITILEKLITTLLVAFFSNLFQEFVFVCNSNYNSNNNIQHKQNNLTFNEH